MWIQTIRRKHDKLHYQVIDPHFTLVFPTDFDESRFVSHVRRQVRQARSFNFVLRCAVVSGDAFKSHSHVFLVPDEGYSDFVKLHDQLYRGALADCLRLDIPYVPHIGVANALDVDVCKRLADELNAVPFEIVGEIDTLDVIVYEDNRVTSLERFSLSD